MGRKPLAVKLLGTPNTIFTKKKPPTRTHSDDFKNDSSFESVQYKLQKTEAVREWVTWFALLFKQRFPLVSFSH